jgi:hypothetical protein
LSTVTKIIGFETSVFYQSYEIASYELIRFIYRHFSNETSARLPDRNYRGHLSATALLSKLQSLDPGRNNFAQQEVQNLLFHT